MLLVKSIKENISIQLWYCYNHRSHKHPAVFSLGTLWGHCSPQLHQTGMGTPVWFHLLDAFPCWGTFSWMRMSGPSSLSPILDPSSFWNLVSRPRCSLSSSPHFHPELGVPVHYGPPDTFGGSGNFPDGITLDFSPIPTVWQMVNFIFKFVREKVISWILKRK